MVRWGGGLSGMLLDRCRVDCGQERSGVGNEGLGGMTLGTAATAIAQDQLTLPQELVLMLLNEESGYFRQVRGWNLHCAMVGAAMAELSLIGRIDTDMESLTLLDATPTGHPALDPILEAIAGESVEHNAQYWVEQLNPEAEGLIDVVLDRLVEMKLLEHHDGDFWTLASTGFQRGEQVDAVGGSATEFVRTRIARVILENEIPDPRDVIIIALINACDVLRFIFPLDEESERRVELVCKMDLIGRAISDAVTQNLTSPLVRRSRLGRSIRDVKNTRMLRNRNLRSGNLPALMADLAGEYGPVFRLKQPFQEPLTVLAGPGVNRWAQREGRRYLTSTKYLDGLEDVYGAHGIIQALDSADHFQMRKAMQQGYSRGRLEEQLETLYGLMRRHMAEWSVGEVYPAKRMSRMAANAQFSPIAINVESQDLFEDAIEYQERALNTFVARVMPSFLLNTPSMNRRLKSIDELIERIQRSHTPAQRMGQPRDIIDDLLSLHANEPQLLPESSLKYSLTNPLLGSMYLGDGLGFAMYEMASQPELQERIRQEAEVLFAEGDPGPKDLAGPNADVTRRTVMETLRMYPAVPGSLRDVMNSCVVEDYELPLGSRVLVLQSAAHYMSEAFPDPFRFDIDRYLPGRDEHRTTSYAPFGLGTHKCLAHRWVEVQMAVDLLMIAHYFRIELSPADAKLRISPFPSMSPSNKVKFKLTEQLRALPV